MKKNLFFCFMLICSLSLFTSCKDDDDTDYSPELTGSYKGDLTIRIPAISYDSTNLQKIILTKSGLNSLTLTLNDFSFPVGEVLLNLGNIIIPDIPIQKQDEGTYNLMPTTTLVGLTAPVGDTEVTVEGSIKGAVIQVTISIPEAMAVGKVNVTFRGNKMAIDNEKTSALITAMTFDSPSVVGQPIITDNYITFTVADTVTNFTFKPTITISEGAVITPATGEVIDFAKGNIKYTVTAEDGIHQTVYTVNYLKAGAHDFEIWTTTTDGNQNTFDIPTNGWACSNEAVSMIKTFANDGVPIYTGPYPVLPLTEAQHGEKAASIQTLGTIHPAFQYMGVPMVTSGTLFTGKFKLTLADIADPLVCTKFGNPYALKPLKFKGWYKYTPGETYYKATSANGTQAEADPSTSDEGSIVAVLYEADTDDFTLTGKDINTSDKAVLRAELYCSKQAGWTSFEVDFKTQNNKNYSKNKTYKLAIVCSSSKAGDKFCGAPGSTLIIDNFEIIAE